MVSPALKVGIPHVGHIRHAALRLGLQVYGGWRLQRWRGMIHNKQASTHTIPCEQDAWEWMAALPLLIAAVPTHLLEHGVVPLAQAVGARRLLAEGVAVQDVVIALRLGGMGQVGGDVSGNVDMYMYRGLAGECLQAGASCARRCKGRVCTARSGPQGQAGRPNAPVEQSNGREQALTARGGQAQMNIDSKPRALAYSRYLLGGGSMEEGEMIRCVSC